MSNYLAVATVTATLQQFLLEALQEANPEADVRIGPPPKQDTVDEFIGANIYLYQVTANAGFRNDHLATRRADGSLIQRPQAALDLHYLFTFYGKVTERQKRLEPEVLLGKTVAALEAQPLLTRDDIDKTIKLDMYSGLLGNSDLGDQVERVRFTPVYLNLDELHKIWTVFQQVTHRLSIVYIASVVMVDAYRDPQVVDPQKVGALNDALDPKKALPVSGSSLFDVPQLPPRLAEVIPAYVEYGEAQITLQGEHLAAEGVAVMFDGLDGAVKADVVATGDLAVTVPDGLRPGRNAVRVVQNVQTDSAAGKTVFSNPRTFVLQPRLNAVSVSAVQPPRVAVPTYTLTVDVAPPLGARQRADLWLNAWQPDGAKAYGYNLTAFVGDEPADTVTFTNTDRASGKPFWVEPGTYLIRLQVDAVQYAESRLVRGRALFQMSNQVEQIVEALDGDTVSQEVTEAFSNTGLELGAATVALTEQSGGAWRLSDQQNGYAYTIRRQDETLRFFEVDPLDVEAGLFVGAFLFRTQTPSPFDEKTILDTVRAGFDTEKPSLALSTQVSLSMKIPQRAWLLTDQQFGHTFLLWVNLTVLRVFQLMPSVVAQRRPAGALLFTAPAPSPLAEKTVLATIKAGFAQQLDVPLSAHVTIDTIRADAVWRIHDPQSGYRYLIQNEIDTLKVFDLIPPGASEALFVRVPQSKASMVQLPKTLDEHAVLNAVSSLLGEQGPFSISTQTTGRAWLIRDQPTGAAYLVRKNDTESLRLFKVHRPDEEYIGPLVTITPPSG